MGRHAMPDRDSLEVQEVETTRVSCDGGGGTLGHPKVYLALADGSAECPYCDRVFVLRGGARDGEGS